MINEVFNLTDFQQKLYDYVYDELNTALAINFIEKMQNWQQDCQKEGYELKDIQQEVFVDEFANLVGNLWIHTNDEFVEQIYEYAVSLAIKQ